MSLASALWDLWPAYLAYFVGFLQIGVMWLNHHRVFQQVRDVDGVLLVLNLNLLMWVVLVPFPTAVVADYLRDGGQNATTAMALFSAVLVANAISFVALFAWITHDERIVGSLPSPAVDPDGPHPLRRRASAPISASFVPVVRGAGRGPRRVRHRGALLRLRSGDRGQRGADVGSGHVPSRRAVQVEAGDERRDRGRDRRRSHRVRPGPAGDAGATPVGPTWRPAAGRAAASIAFDFAVVADFDDEAAWRAYDTDAEHNRLRAELIRPLIAERVITQFTVA